MLPESPHYAQWIRATTKRDYLQAKIIGRGHNGLNPFIMQKCKSPSCYAPERQYKDLAATLRVWIVCWMEPHQSL